MLGLSWHSTSSCHAAILRGVPIALAQSIASWDDSVLNSWERRSSSAVSVSSAAAALAGKTPLEKEVEGGGATTRLSTSGPVENSSSASPVSKEKGDGSEAQLVDEAEVILHEEEEEGTVAVHTPFARSDRTTDGVNKEGGGSEGEGDEEVDLELEYGEEEEEEEAAVGYAEDGYLYAEAGDVLDERFTLIQHIGSGQSSTVWLAKYQEDDSLLPNSDGAAGKSVRTQGKGLPSTPFHPYVAIKIFRCEEGLQTAMKYEQKLSQYVQRQFDAKLEAATSRQAAAANDPPENGGKGSGRVNKFLGSCRFLSSFVIRGDYGDHACAVFEVLGPPLDDLLKTYGYAGIPDPRLLRSILTSCLEGLQLLGDLHVVHTDLKPENLVLTTPSDEVMRLMGIDPAEYAEQLIITAKKEAQELAEAEGGDAAPHYDDPADLKVKIVDFGLSYVIPTALKPRQVTADEKELLYIGNYQRGITIQTREYRAPEIILGADFGPKADVWSFGCLAFELVTGLFLFDPKDNPNTNDEEDLMDIEHLQEISGFNGKVPLHLLQEPNPARQGARGGSSTNLRASAVQTSGVCGTGSLCGVHTENYFDLSNGDFVNTIRRPKQHGSSSLTRSAKEEPMFGEEISYLEEENEESYDDYASPHVGSSALVEEKIFDAFGGDQEETDEFMHFLRACVAWDPNKRLSPCQLLQHPWMARSQ